MTAGARLPGWVRILGLAGVLLLALPVIGLLAEVDWSRLAALITSRSALIALGLSLRTALAATLVSVVVGVPVALVLARGDLGSPLLRLVRTLVLLPLFLPPVVGGIALLATWGRQGRAAPLLEAVGIDIAFTTVAVVLAQVFVAVPFLILAVEGALRSQGTSYEATAMTLGASPTRTLLRVTLPRLAPSLASGTVLAFARAVGEFGATLTFAGSLQGVTRTLPLEIYLQREIDQDAAIAMSLLLVVLAAAVVALAYRSPSLPALSDVGPLGRSRPVPERPVAGGDR